MAFVRQSVKLFTVFYLTVKYKNLATMQSFTVTSRRHSTTKSHIFKTKTTD